MTFIIGATSGHYAFMASDRMVSIAGRSYEPQTNKNVVLQVLEGMIIIGYTGVAYIGPTPMDRWIAETAIGKPLALGMSFGVDTPSLWQVIERLRKGLQREFSGRLRKQYTELMIVGLRGDKHRVRHVFWHITHHPGVPGRISWTRHEDRHPKPNRIYYRWIGQSSDQITSRMTQRIHEGSASVDQFETVLDAAVRETGQAYPGTVGQDVMSIRVTPGDGRPNLLVTYRPHELVLTSAFDQIERPAAYTPWVISADGWFSPALVTGDSGWIEPTLDFSVVNVAVTAEVSPDATYMGWRNAPRRAAPGFTKSSAANLVASSIFDLPGACSAD